MSDEAQKKKIDELEAELLKLRADDKHIPQPGRQWGKNNQKRGGNNNRGGKTMPKPNVSSPRPQNLPAAPPVPGAYLSKTPSVLSNDPLAQNAYFPAPSEELRPAADRQKIYPGCEGMMPLMTETYNQLSAKSPNYRKVVPRSAHDYYMATLLYARLLHLHERNSNYISYDEKEFLNSIYVNSAVNGGYSVPYSFGLYMSGFGNTTLPNGRDISFGFRRPDLAAADAEPRITGFFGDIDGHMGQYSSYPSLGVFAQRMIEDLRFTALNPNQRGDGAWNLPGNLGNGRPLNENLLGYSPAVFIPESQMDCFREAHITPNQFEMDNPYIPLNIELLNYVSAKMSVIGNFGYKFMSVPDSQFGSVGQLCYESISQLLNPRLASASFRPNSTLRLISSAEYLGSSFLYNIDKFNVDDAVRRLMLPVTFDEDDDLPEGIDEDMGFGILHSDQSLYYDRFQGIDFRAKLRVEVIVAKDLAA